MRSVRFEMILGEKLSLLRKQNGFSQEELAEAIGVSRQAVSKWERAESAPDTDNLIELARLYGVSLDDLVNGNELPSKTPAIRSAEGEESDNRHWEDDGLTVDIKDNEITVKNEDGEEKVYDKTEWKRKRSREKRCNATITGVFSLLAVIAYLILGFCLKNGKGWSCGWILFLLIPVVSSGIEAFYYKRVAAFAYPVLVTAIYCALGMIRGLWHPTWVIFITIPIYYIAAERIDRATRTRDQAAIEDALDERKKK